MFTKPMFSVAAALLLASSSICVGSVKVSDIIHIGQSLASFAPQNGLTKASGCFSEFFDNQVDTVRKMGEDWEVCADTETRANANMKDNLEKVTYEVAKVPNDFCVQVENDCRDKFARDGDILAAFDCYIQLPIPGRGKILAMGEKCKLEILNAENESRSIISTKKNCTNEANFDYLKRSDYLFEKVVTTCDISSSDGSTNFPPSQSTWQPSIGSTTTKAVEVPSTTEVVPPSPTISWETEPTTKRGRFPWS